MIGDDMIPQGMREILSGRRSVLPEMPRLPNMREHMSTAMLMAAGDAFQALRESIQAFEAGLAHDQEVGVYLVSSADGRTFHAETIEHRAGLFLFSGSMNGKPVCLAQHHTQLNILLTVLDKTEAEPRRIGFITARDEER